MRTHDQLLTALLAAFPTREEALALTEKELATLRRAGNGLDNILYLASAKGRATVMGQAYQDGVPVAGSTTAHHSKRGS